MPITDERRISFDIDSIKDVLKSSQNAAMAIGLLNTDPSDIVLKPAVGAVLFNFDGTEVSVGSDKLGALLMSFCIRSGIRIPRQGKRNVLVEPTTITLTLTDEFVMIPSPKPTVPKRAPASVMSWTGKPA